MTIRAHRLWLPAVLLMAGCPMDSRDCTADFRNGLNVTVVNGAERGMCLVTVTASEGSFSEELSCTTTEASTCLCYGVGERPGRYQIEVMTEDDVVASREVVVKADDCHVILERVTVSVPAD